MSIGFIYLFGFLLFQPDWLNVVILDPTFWLLFIFYLITIQEFFNWAKVGKRSEMSDIVAIFFFFFFILFFTKDLMTSMMGAFSIYLWVGVVELKEYPVINKILIISLVTYNAIFIAGLVSFYYGDPFVLNTTFAFSFWIILGLGFLLFGRKYIVVWRFMSPAYLVLFLYIIAWLAVIFLNQFTPLDFNTSSPFQGGDFTLIDFIMNIYFILIIVNWIVYFFTGPLLDKLLGIKRVEDENLITLVENVKKDIGIKGNVKVGFGKYPILNAMAYGSVFDKRIAIIAEEMTQIPEDELKGIIAHELAHTKGMHTLILTFITSGDLIVRMLFGIPATYYDYTFGNPQIPMITFLFLNLGIYMFLYIFVRILEGKADLMSKKAGYAKELAKALYNLESFYATGREIGLNTMLLCDEKITKENQILDYYETAHYLNKSLIRPSRASLLGNFLNSHPPSYHRIAAILGDSDLKPGKEALLPFICLKGSKQKKYAKKFEKAREAFKIIANEKFKEFFGIDDISLLLEDLGRRNLYNYDINKEFLFKNRITSEYIVARLEDVQFIDDVCESDQLIITNLKNNQKEVLNATLYTRTLIALNKTYFFQKDNPLRLVDIELTEDLKDGNYVFLEKNETKIIKPIKKTKLPNTVNIINEFKDQDVFLKLKGDLKIFKCIKVDPADNIDDFELELKLIDGIKSDNQEIVKYRVGDLIIRPKKIYIAPSRNITYRKSEVDILNWLLKEKLRAFVYLKKPVNNLEIGYIEEVNVDIEKLSKNLDADEKEEKNYIIVRNIFGESKKIPYKTLEIVSFEYSTATMQLKSDTSPFSQLGYVIMKKFKPQKVFYLNK